MQIRTFQPRANYPELTTLATEFSHLETLTVQRYSFTADKWITDTELHLFSDVYSKALAMEYNIRKKELLSVTHEQTWCLINEMISTPTLEI